MVAVPGDSVEQNSETGYLAVNGDCIIGDSRSGMLEASALIIPRFQYFVVGDNYLESMDSRDQRLGLISINDIIGVVRLNKVDN